MTASGAEWRRRLSPYMMRSATDPETGTAAKGRGREIPAPDLPVEPVLDVAAIFRRAHPTPCVLDAGPSVFPDFGRHAIKLALRRMGVGPGHQVLLPSYHCDSMVHPVEWVGATPVFYRIGEDLSADLDDVERRVNASTRALIVVHYFGFHQDMPRIAAFCASAGLQLLEDCAHCFYGSVAGRPVGAHGDYAIASFRKFFPVAEGACLTSVRHDLPASVGSRPGIVDSARSAYRLLERATVYGNLLALQPVLGLVRRGRGHRPGIEAPSSQGAVESPTPLPERYAGTFGNVPPSIAMTSFSRVILRANRATDAPRRRRENWLMLRDVLRGTSGCRPLRDALASGEVPHVFPLWIDDLPRVFPMLEDAAIPMQRFGQFPWPEMDAAAFPFSVALSRHVVQLACHQGLGPADIRSIAGRVVAALSGGI